MATVTLTARYLDLLKPQHKRYEVFDTIVPGFAIHVTPSGHKSFTLYYRHHGRPAASRVRPLSRRAPRRCCRKCVLAPAWRPCARFTRDRDGTLRHSYSAHPWMAEDVKERGIDLLTPVYNVLDLTPQGRGDWHAKLAYPDGQHWSPR